MRIWVDIESGTWGEAKNIRFIDFDMTSPVERDFYETFAEKSDSYRMEAGEKWGVEPQTLTWRQADN